MSAAGVMDVAGLEGLVDLLHARGYRVVAPTVRHGAISYESVDSAAELPIGVGDEQAPARYRLRERGDAARFGYAAAPSSWKRHLQPPRSVLWRAERDASGSVSFREERVTPEPVAFIGVRACELAAILVQDRVFIDSAHPDLAYAARRSGVLVIAVQCGEPAGTCFCASMDTGPRAREGFDIALTEVDGDGDHPRYLVEAGSAAGEELMTVLRIRPADDDVVGAAEWVTASAIARMGRRMDTEGIPDLLLRNREHPRWQDVADRCLACGNCTMACPTCFCSDEVETQPVDGAGGSTRERQWASCFSLDFSYIHGGAVRPSVHARYRQWMTHKLSTWWDQFDSSGCVGCGRCITWCPVGIDITEEVAAIRASDGAVRGEHA